MILNRKVITFIALVCFSGFLSAQEDPISGIGVDAGLYNNYVWRGLVFDENPVLQTDLWMWVHGVTMIFWGNCDLTDQDDDFEGQFNEWDVYITFPIKHFGSFQFGGELDYLSFPSSSGMEGAATSEISLWCDADLPGYPRLQVFWDIWAWHGIYANLNAYHSVTLGSNALLLSSGIGWGDENHNRQTGADAGSGFLDFHVGMSYDFIYNDRFSVTPKVQFTTLLNGDVRDLYDSNDIEPSRFSISLNAAYTLVYP
jgi:hypothetical protein